MSFPNPSLYNTDLCNGIFVKKWMDSYCMLFITHLFLAKNAVFTLNSKLSWHVLDMRCLFVT